MGSLLVAVHPVTRLYFPYPEDWDWEETMAFLTVRIESYGAEMKRQEEDLRVMQAAQRQQIIAAMGQRTKALKVAPTAPPARFKESVPTLAAKQSSPAPVLVAIIRPQRWRMGRGYQRRQNRQW